MPETCQTRPHHPGRNSFINMSDDELSMQSDVSAFQASGPGGQKRNRKYSAVRITHLPTGVSAVSSESRDQGANRRTAFARVRMEIALGVDGPPLPRQRLDTGPSHPTFPLLAAWIFDALWADSFHVADAAARLGISTAGLVKILEKDQRLWREAATQRKSRGLSQLRPK